MKDISNEYLNSRTGWLIDIAAPPEVSRMLVAQVARRAFKGDPFKTRVKAKGGTVEVKTVSGVAARPGEAYA